MKTRIRNFTEEELKKKFIALGYPVYRAGQVFKWVQGKNVSSFSEMTNLPKTIIEKLDEKFDINKLVCADRKKGKDGTQKFLWELAKGEYVESVLIRDRKRRTICLSTQAGCKFKCPFCASGKGGFKRDLDVSEIVGQVMEIQEITKEKATNIVFMGMGEPLDNYDNLTNAIRILNDKNGQDLGGRKITVSTCGVVPGILKLMKLGIQVELSVSLHATNDKLRDELVPVNKKYPLAELLSACTKYFKATSRVITLEYALIKDKNDSVKDADAVSRIAHRIKAKVNLIECNSYKYYSPTPGRVQRFKERIMAQGSTVMLRRSRGSDILAACGQLAGGKSS
ncbi:MAG: 23S rRNA (adenine(2503)-C(2))-methyltransferase RlmN [Candidatus Aadella gelida]|nr:23S rRNA (adenine(2503)-C(2))-methyltransferase RlmN [Candidatus Aadella gelida]